MSSRVRKFESGHKKRQNKKRIEELIRSQTGALDKFVTKESRVSAGSEHIDVELPFLANVNVSGDVNVDIDIELPDVANVNAPDVIIVPEVANINSDGAYADASNATNVNTSTTHSIDNQANDSEDIDGNHNDDVDNDDTGLVLNIFDPRNWDSLNSKMIDVLVVKGPHRDLSIEKGPKDKFSRRFSAKFFTRVLTNGEKHDRDWLVYSKELDKVFCFCCKIWRGRGQLSNEGFGDWAHLGIRLKEHETSVEHVKNITTWFELRLRLLTNQTIDKEAQKQFEREKDHWRKVLVRIISIVKYLAKHNLAFRGSNAKLHQSSNGNFLGLIEMLAEFDPVIQEHVHRITNEAIHFHYLGPRIQNELILLLASAIKCQLIKKIKQAKYFSVILDCTPDTSHQEQMSLILRYVDVSSELVSIEESFLGFLEVDDTTGKGLFDVLQKELKSLDLDIDNVRGQSYDNGSNMKGKHQGVQKRLIDINRRAFHTSCASHSLNLTLCDMANTCGKARDFFGIIQRIYTIFANSTKRWLIFKDNVPGLTVKSLSSTRWESRVDSVRAIRFQILEVREALLEVADSDNDSKIESEAKSLAKNELGDFEFLVSLVIWYDILYAINLVSKHLQSKDMLIDVAIEKIKELISFFRKYRETGFLNALETAKEIAMKLNTDPVFPQRRIIRRKKQFDESRDDISEVTSQSAEQSFKTNYFLYIVDQAIVSLTRRFEQYQEYENIFGFLFTSHKLHSLDDICLKSSCSNLEAALKNDQHYDISGDELYVELKLLQEFLPTELMHPIEILQYLKRNNFYPNTIIVYRILLTIPVTVASAERSFSKLKLLKSYMRSTMTQDRLNGLALISIENNLLDKIDYEEMIEDFISNNVRRIALFK